MQAMAEQQAVLTQCCTSRPHPGLSSCGISSCASSLAVPCRCECCSDKELTTEWGMIGLGVGDWASDKSAGTRGQWCQQTTVSKASEGLHTGIKSRAADTAQVPGAGC